jgi:2-hydroxy-3-keto-5-methylthiopentenyl-1-phosphate phosphatase
MDDENSDDDFDLRDFHEQATSGSTNPFGLFGSITGNTSPDYSEEVELAMKLIQAGEAFDEFVDYAKEHDIDLDGFDRRSMIELDMEQKIVMYGFLATASGLGRMDEIDSSSDDNPFRVDDDERFR